MSTPRSAAHDSVRAVDYHTAGEPFRIVAQPPVALDGDTVADRRMRAIASPQVQELRRFLCWEPRGHADMYGCFVTPPDDADAHLGVLFWHRDGFSTACGHGTIALGAWAVESGLVAADADGVTDVVIDVPSGRVTARVHLRDGAVTGVDFLSVPSCAVALDIPVTLERYGFAAPELTVDIGFGGALYAHVDVTDIGLSVRPEALGELIGVAGDVKAALADTEWTRFAADERLAGIYGVIFYERETGADAGDGALRHRNVTVFADGQVDRSPCGSGTASRVAVLAARGELDPGRRLVHTSIIDTVFESSYVPADPDAGIGSDGPGGSGTGQAGYPVVLPTVSGNAYLTGRHEFVTAPGDRLIPGFLLER